MKGKITERQARLVCRVVVELTARKRCGQDLSGLASHCGVSVGEKDTIIEAAKDEGLINNLYQLLTTR